MRVAVVLVAAGSGARLGHALPKAFVPLGGRPLLVWAAAAARCVTDDIIVAVPAGWTEPAAQLVPGARIVTGDSTRAGSVTRALAAVADDIDAVLVHDAARPLTPESVFERVVAALAAEAVAVVPTVPIVDTVRHLGVGGAAPLGAIAPRADLAAVQTPQGFRRDVLVAAYASGSREATDDAAVVAAAGHPVHPVAGDDRAFKITVPADLTRAEQVCNPGMGALPRVGIGVDVHGVDPDAPLALAGLAWPGEPGLAGHSDGDVVCHAIADAVLTAAGLGDLGAVLGTDDLTWNNATGVAVLGAVVARVAASGQRIGNVAVQLVGARPRIAARRAEAEQRLSAVVGAPVHVAATTTDGLGFLGRDEGLAAIATALVVNDS